MFALMFLLELTLMFIIGLAVLMLVWLDVGLVLWLIGQLLIFLLILTGRAVNGAQEVLCGVHGVGGLHCVNG